jgi:hypothetical protein
MTVEVYFNLHRKCLSIRQGGKVIGYQDAVVLRDVTFKVSQKGRERVLREKAKNVHAFIKGSLTELPAASGGRLIRYNPYLNGFFFFDDTGEQVERADEVHVIGRKIFLPG